MRNGGTRNLPPNHTSPASIERGRAEKEDREIVQRAKADETAHRLMTIPGIGPVTAVALTALAPPAQTFRRGRDFAAWVGLTHGARVRLPRRCRRLVQPAGSVLAGVG